MPTKATYNLAAIKAAVARQGTRAFTKSALDGGFAMGLTSAEMLAAVQRTTAAQLHKTMPSVQNPGVWQDVYRVPTPAGLAYIKYTYATSIPKVVISFKEL